MSEFEHGQPSTLSSSLEETDDIKSKRLRANFHGVVYQILVCMLCILRMQKEYYEKIDNNIIFNYEITPEKSDCGNYDDIYIDVTENDGENEKTRRSFVQTKRKKEHMQKKITTNYLLSPCDAIKMSLDKYLKSFVEIQSKFGEECEMEILICTNNVIKSKKIPGENIRKVSHLNEKLNEEPAYGDLYIQEVEDTKFLHTKDSKCFKFVSDAHETYYNDTVKTIMNFLKIKSDKTGVKTKIDLMKEWADRIMKFSFIYIGTGVNHIRLEKIPDDILNFLMSNFLEKDIYEGEMVLKPQKKVLEFIKGISGDSKTNLELDFSKLTLEENDIHTFKEIFMRKIKARAVNYDLVKIRVGKQIYEKTFETKRTKFPFHNPFTEENVKQFIKYQKYIVKHPSNIELRKILAREMGELKDFIDLKGCETLAVDSLFTVVCKKLEIGKETPFTKESFKKFARNFTGTIKSMQRNI